MLEHIWVGGVCAMSVCAQESRIEANPQSPWNLLSIGALSMCRLSECTLNGGVLETGLPRKKLETFGKMAARESNVEISCVSAAMTQGFVVGVRSRE